MYKILVKIENRKFRRMLEDNEYDTKKMAEIIGISRNTLNAKIVGSIKFTLEDIILITKELKIDISDFIKDYFTITTKEG